MGLCGTKIDDKALLMFDTANILYSKQPDLLKLFKMDVTLHLTSCMYTPRSHKRRLRSKNVLQIIDLIFFSRSVSARFFVFYLFISYNDFKA